MYQYLLFVLFLVLRSLFRSLDFRGSNPVAPDDITQQLAIARTKCKLHHVVLGPSDRSKVTHVIVLLHGWGQSHKAWLKTAEAASQRHPSVLFILPDLIAFGKSSDACAGLSVSPNVYVEQIDFLIRVEQVTHLPLFVGGISMGGGVALQATRVLRQRKIKIQQLILVAPAGLPNKTTFGPMLLLTMCRVFMIHHVIGIITSILGKTCLPRLAPWYRRLCLAVNAPTYGLERGAFALDDDQIVHLVWGDCDIAHEYALSDFYWTKVLRLHLKTIQGWGHSQICNKLHQLDLHVFDRIWTYVLDGDVASDVAIRPPSKASTTPLVSVRNVPLSSVSQNKKSV